MLKEYLEAGKIVGAHALKGEVKINPWCDSAEFLCDFEVLYLDKGKEILEIENARPHKNLAIIKFKSYDTLEQSEGLKNKILYIRREDIELGENCYFIQELIGLEVIDNSSQKIYGKLTDVMQTGANDVYVITDDTKKEYLIPAIPDVIIKTDIEENKMYISPLEGLFDD